MKDFYKKLAIPVIALLSFSTVLSGEILQMDSIKANYILGMCEFTTWKSKDKEDRITIGIWGHPNLYEKIKSLINANIRMQINFQVKEINNLDGINGSDVVYVSPSYEKQWTHFKAENESPEIVSLGESKVFYQNGGIVQFVTEKNRLRFRINTERLSEKLQMSSKLLTLAID